MRSREAWETTSVRRFERAALGLARRRLVLEPEREQPLDDVQERAQAIAGRADAIGAHERGIERGDVGLDHPLGDAGREEVERAAGVGAELGASVPAGPGDRGPRAQIGSHQQRLEHACRRAGGGQALVAARRRGNTRDPRPSGTARPGRHGSSRRARRGRGSGAPAAPTRRRRIGPDRDDARHRVPAEQGLILDGGHGRPPAIHGEPTNAKGDDRATAIRRARPRRPGDPSAGAP